MREISALLLAALLLSTTCRAGPVSTDAVQAADAGAPVSLQPAAPGTLRSEAPPSAAAGSTVVSTEAAPAPSALAVEILEEAEAGAQPSEPARPTNARAPRSATTPSARDAADGAPGLREFGKAALHWIKDAVPWLRGDADDQPTGNAATLDSAGWSASPLDGGPAGRNTLAGAALRPAGGHDPALQPSAAVGYGNAALPPSMDPNRNLMQEFISAVHEVLEHPMTWLVVSLIVIGAIVVKRIDRRPTK